MQLVCLSFHHIKTGYDNFLKVKFESRGQFYENSKGESVLLQTGTRVEVYAYTDDEDSLLRMFTKKSGLKRSEIEEFFNVYLEKDAVLHLFRMAGSIESRVLGETYIPLLIESAFLHAQERGAVGPQMESLFNTAIRVGKRARDETGIEGTVAVADIAVKSIQKEVPDRDKKTVMLLGAGSTGMKVAAALAKQGHDIVVMNRNHEIGEVVAREINGKSIEYPKLKETLEGADVLVCATLASHYRVLPEMIAKRGSPLVIVDVSPFGNVSPEVESIENVILKNGGLEKAVKENHETALAEVANVEQIINEELSNFKKE
jgi:glutamyl-tRNA reductase